MDISREGRCVLGVSVGGRFCTGYIGGREGLYWVGQWEGRSVVDISVGGKVCTGCVSGRFCTGWVG